MNLNFKLLLFISFFFNALAYGQNLTNSMDTLSYSLGVRIASDFKKQGLTEVNAEAFAAAINDVLKGNDLKVSEADAMKNIQAHFEGQKAKQYEAVKSAGEKFLAENKARDSVITLASGLQYEVLKAGEGAPPAATDNVTVHYHGMLIDGTVFDSSVDRGQPASFPVNGVIAGWVEALQLMAPGSKWKLFIPSDLAYGQRGAGPKIQPFSTLIFEVELLSIK